MRDFREGRVTADRYTLRGGHWQADVFANMRVPENEALVAHSAACWNAVRDALAEYDDPHKSLTSTTATRMADILRGALDA